MESVPVMENGYEHPGSDRMTRVGLLTCQRAVSAGLVLGGVGASLAILFLGLPIPSFFLFDLESMVFWALVLGSLILGVMPILARVASFTQVQPTEPQFFILFSQCLASFRGCLGLAGALVVFSIPLASMWFTGRTTYYHVGGLLPWSDASNYLHGGNYLLNQGSLDAWNMRRPLNVAYLATRLALVGENLQLALVLQAWVAALACFLASRELARRYGTASGILMFALLYQFIRPYLGTTLSESLGLSFGCLGFAVLVAAAKTAKPRLLLAAGLLFLTLGLNARAGAFLVLPALVLWGGLLGPAGRMTRAVTLTVGLSGVAAGFILNSLLLIGFGNEKGMANENFSVVLYGLAVGGKRWPQVYADHPEVAVLEREDPREAARYIFRLAGEAMTEDPTRILVAYLGGMGLFGIHLFGFIRSVEVTGHSGAIVDANLIPVLILLALLGLGLLGARLKEAESRCFLLAMAGIVLSAPFVYYGGGDRAFATTLPFVAALPGIGLAALRQLWRPADPDPVAPRPVPNFHLALRPVPWGPLLTGALLTLGVTVGPSLAVATHDQPNVQATVCDDGLVPVVFRLGRGSPSLRIADLSKAGAGRVPEITFDQFRSDPTFAGVELAPALRKVGPGSWIVHAFNLQPGSRNYREQLGVFDFGQVVWVIVNDRVGLAGSPGATVQVCGEPDLDVKELYLVLHARQVRLVE